MTVSGVSVAGQQLSRVVLGLDALGCLASAGLLAVAPAALRPVDPTLRSRWPLVAGLVVTAGVCGVGASKPEPSAADLTRAATANAAWVATCTAALPGRDSPAGAALVAAIGILDATMGITQLALRHVLR